MKSILITILLLLTFSIFAQNISKVELDKEIKPLTDKIRSLNSDNAKLKRDFEALNSKLDSLKKQTKTSIDATNQELVSKISTTETNTNQKILKVDESLSTNSLYGIIGVLAAVLVSILLYFLLNRKQQSDKSEMVEQLNKTKSSIEESLVKEFGKQTELMETQIRLIEDQKNIIKVLPNLEIDHSLALKVADEITLIERNISLMDSGTKGLKQLSRSVNKLKDNLAANGYLMPELLGKPLNRGMHSIPVTTVPNENLEPGVEMITKVIKPQVNYNDKMIQAAQIEVSVGY